MSSEIRRTRAVLAYENPYARVYDDHVRFPSGAEGRHLRIEPPDVDARGVVVVAELASDDGVELALVRSFRYPVGEEQWGFPRGHAHGSDPLVTAAVEAEEELGAVLEDPTVIGSFTPDSGLLAHRVDVVRGRARSRSTSPRDVDEVAEVAWVSPDGLLDRIADGEVDDGMTIVALTQWLLWRRTGLPGGRVRRPSSR